MPRLPDKTALGAPPQVSDRPIVQLSEPKVDDGMLAKAVASGVGELAGTVQKQQDETDNYEIQKALVDFDLDQEKRLDDAKRSAEPEARDFTVSYRSGYDDAARSFMSRVPEHLKPKVDEILVKRGAAFEKRAYDFELKERDRYFVSDIKSRTDDLLTHSMGNPESMDDNAARGIALIKSSRLSERAKVDATRKFLDANYEYGIKSMIDRATERGEDVTDLITRLRKVKRGDLSGPAPGGDAAPSTIDFIKREEGDKDNGWDVRQYSGPYGVKRGANERLTLDEAEKRLKAEVARVQADMDAKITAPLSEGQRTALTSLFYNIGTGKGRLNQVAALINSGNIDKVPAWIRQFNRDADGRYLPGLRDRRSREADLFAKSKDSAASTPVERADIPPPGETGATKVAEGPTDTKTDATPVGPTPPEIVKDDTSPKLVVGEDGKPTISTDIADTKSDIPGAPKPGTPTAPSDDLEETDDVVPFEHLTPATRRKLINYARVSGRAVATRDIESDIARIRMGQEPVVGPDGKTSIERARAHMTNMQFAKAKEKWDAAAAEYRDLAPLRGMPAEEMADHIGGIVTRAEENGESIAAAAARRKKAEQEQTKILAMRDKDPVRSVMGFDSDETDGRRAPLPATREALRAIKDARAPETVTGPDGQRVPVGQPRQAMTPQQQWETLFEARLKDQKAVMPDDPEKWRILSRAEAEKLLKMPKDGKGLDDRAYRQRLEDAAKKAEKMFGPKYAKRALEEAIGFSLNDQGHESTRKTILRKVATGEPILVEDLRQARELDALGQTSLAGALARAGQISSIGRMGNVVSPPLQADTGSPAIGRTVTPADFDTARRATPPNEKQQQWLRNNPDGWQVFDERFGPGAAARVLGNPASDAYKKTLPKSDNASEFKSMERKTGWFGR